MIKKIQIHHILIYYGFFFLGLKETAEEMVKNRLEGKDNLTPWQKYLEKKKEKRILKKKRKVMFILTF